MNSIQQAFAREGFVRPNSGRLVAGVCAGLGRKLGLSPGRARLLFVVVLMILPGSQILVYPLLWLLMPSEVAEGATPGSAFGGPKYPSA